MDDWDVTYACCANVLCCTDKCVLKEDNSGGGGGIMICG